MFAPRDPDEYLLDSERRVIRVRRHWACLMWELFEAVGLLLGVVMVSYLLPPDSQLLQNVLWYAGLLVLVRFAYQIPIGTWAHRDADKRFLIAKGLFTIDVGMMPVTKVTDLTSTGC